MVTVLQGTVVVPCSEFCHKDPKLWERPDQFYPEHFLNPDGSFNARTEGFMPFGVGECTVKAFSAVWGEWVGLPNFRII